MGNFLAIFVPGSERRSRVRGNVNVILYTPRIKRFIKRVYHEPVKSVKFIRQVTLNRVCCMVNDKYYVKVFRNITPERVKSYQNLIEFLQKRISVRIPTVHADDKMAMYVSEKIPGRGIYTFDKATILKNEKKIKKQVTDIVTEIQSIKITDIPNYKNFFQGLQPKRATEPVILEPHMVLAHFDLNETNFLFDDNMNIIGILDWDMCSIAKNPETDLYVFNRFWNNFINKIKKSI